MREYLTLGPTPYDEPCAQVGDADYEERSFYECYRYISLLRKMFGDPPGSPRFNFGMRSFPHDMGTYRECVVSFDTDIPETIEFAFRVENNLPATWDG